MKIALISSQQTWGGGEQLLYTLGLGLEKLGKSVVWVVPEEGKLNSRLAENGSERITYQGRHPSPSRLLKLRREIKARGVDVLHGNETHAISLCGVLTLGQQARPWVVGVKHTIFPIRSAMRYNWVVDRLVCVSRAVREVSFEAGILERKLTIVRAGIDIPEYDRREARQAICRELNVAPDLPLLCGVGSLIPCKGYDTLIDAAAKLRTRIGDFRLAICGEGSMRSQLESQIARLGLQSQVKLIGFIRDPNLWIAAADVFVHPSRSEGLPLVSLAAQKLGTPIVASEVGGLREVMRCEYTSRMLGWVLQADLPDHLSELIVDALTSTEKRLERTKAARRAFDDGFSVPKMVNGFLRVYEEGVKTDGQMSNCQTSLVA
jgi:glycosyltransferase involved in cell wall biosynthesis